MGATSSKRKTAKNQSETTTRGSVVHQTLTSTRRASFNSHRDEGIERRPSLTRESSNLTRPTAINSSNTVDGTTRPRRASVHPRTSPVMEEPPTVDTSTKPKASSGSRSIFMCCMAGD